jgi:hypothetical protein
MLVALGCDQDSTSSQAPRVRPALRYKLTGGFDVTRRAIRQQRSRDPLAIMSWMRCCILSGFSSTSTCLTSAFLSPIVIVPSFTAATDGG